MESLLFILKTYARRYHSDLDPDFENLFRPPYPKHETPSIILNLPLEMGSPETQRVSLRASRGTLTWGLSDARPEPPGPSSTMPSA